jgi:hypothetical protein
MLTVHGLPNTNPDELTRAAVAQLDRASGFEPEGRGFESLRPRQFLQALSLGHR